MNLHILVKFYSFHMKKDSFLHMDILFAVKIIVKTYIHRKEI